ncbi:hypothetical protein BC830DRAFT_394422 [Chytriomyces sp. MP71]|nr:hypothetical protein BC830DRAFT_394422 [Chytriomyces sp. MP71]
MAHTTSRRRRPSSPRTRGLIIGSHSRTACPTSMSSCRATTTTASCRFLRGLRTQSPRFGSPTARPCISFRTVPSSTWMHTICPSLCRGYCQDCGIGRFVLVTGDSSVCVPDCIIGREDATALALSRLLLHWYTSHCSGIDRYAHKVSCMPLGIDQHKNARREIQSAYDAGVGLLNGLMQQPANLLKVQKDKFLLVSFQVSTNPEKRVPVWELFCGTANVSDHFASLRTVSNCFYQQDISSQTFYRGILSQHQFVVSPEGYGLDCYRTYETLLLGSYPIVKTSTLDGLFKSLPVLIVQEWSDLTVELLRDTFTDFQTRKWDFSSLYMFYWKQKFRSHL